MKGIFVLKNITGKCVWFGMLALFLMSVSGCVFVSLESNKDAIAAHRMDRIFIMINQGDFSQSLSKSLAAAFVNCFSNTPTKIDIAIVSPLDLDVDTYRKQSQAFRADGLLEIEVQGGTVEIGGYPTIMYNASLFDPPSYKRVWRAVINNSGSTLRMDRRMREMAEEITSRLKQDGFVGGK